jgi:uncharacterized protein (TIGR02145 family)
MFTEQRNLLILFSGIMFLTTVSCDRHESPPVTGSTVITDVAITTAQARSNIIWDGDSPLIECGICWSTDEFPSRAGEHTADEAKIGQFYGKLVNLQSGTKYWVRSYAENRVGVTYGSITSFTTGEYKIPTVYTKNITEITHNTATGGGEIAEGQSSSVVNKGVCWSRTPHPTVNNSKTSHGSGPGPFAGSLSGLTPGTTYYIRAYAENIKGIGYGEELSFRTLDGTVTDYDNNSYNTIKIGNQEWMTGNLRTTHYSNGDLIPTTTPQILNISAETEPKYQWTYFNQWIYTSNPPDLSVYGKLYTWYAATDSRNICPTGWHLPSDAEWSELITYLGGNDVAGGKLKEALNFRWENPNMGATNESGFTALPSGYRNNTGQFLLLYGASYWWSATESTAVESYGMFCGAETTKAIRTTGNKVSGFSVRCIKN